MRFTLWTLVAVWATAIFAAGVTYLVVGLTESGEGRYHNSDYNRLARCTGAPARRLLVPIRGFVPVSTGQTALVSGRADVRTPELIYVWSRRRGCVAEWSLDDPS